MFCKECVGRRTTFGRLSKKEFKNSKDFLAPLELRRARMEIINSVHHVACDRQTPLRLSHKSVVARHHNSISISHIMTFYIFNITSTRSAVAHHHDIFFFHLSSNIIERVVDTSWFACQKLPEYIEGRTVANSSNTFLHK